MNRIDSVSTPPPAEVASGAKLEVTVRYQATADRTIKVISAGLKVKPPQFTVSGSRSEATQPLTITLDSGSKAGEPYVLTFSMADLTADLAITVK